MNLAIKIAHCDYERNLCKDWVWSKTCKKERQKIASNCHTYTHEFVEGNIY